MKCLRLIAKGLVLIAVATLSLMPMSATAVTEAKEKATSKALAQVTISLTAKGMMVTMPHALKGGDYRVTIKNSTSEPRGVEMIGIDRKTSPTVRYTQILKPGKTEQFRWYFPKGKTTYVRDIMSCTHDQRTCMVVTFGQMRKAIEFP